MAGKSAAKAGDIKATAGTTMYSPAVTGSWVAGPVQPVTGYAKLTTGGSQVVHEAKCTFSFTGTGPSPGNAPVSGTSTVTLSGKTTKLQKGKSNVIHDGDSEQDSYGNKLEAQASGKLKTS
jgi:hypothetical protein